GAEERNDDATAFEFDGQKYWLISNLEIEKANWKQETTLYSVSGQVTNDEMKQIIMSIRKEE
ncbi:MAG: hypothetical protein IJ042_03160, partial [Butyricicoccus sp.]|nr:hypothetical protein [Butyricicoccus sp.]